MCISRQLFYVFLTISFGGRGQQTESKANKEPYSLLLTTKFHSTGHSPYSGIYRNNNLNAEVGLSFKYKQIGAFVNKNVDFADAHSSINFTTIGFYKSFQLGKAVKLMPYAGYFFNQSYSFIDDNSDMWTALVVRITINRWMSIENTTLLGNLIQHFTKPSLANRLNVTMVIGKFKLDVYTWYTHTLKQAPHFVSSSLAITSPDWVITPTISVRAQVAMLQYVTTKRPEDAMHRGYLISLIIPIDLSPNISTE